MIFLTEKYKRRLKELAGILNEVVYNFTDQEKKDAFIGFENRTKYDKDLMVKAIREGWEVGILFFSKNDKYQMRTYKSRIICPVALGNSKKGNPVLRAFHRVGQSEGAGLQQKKSGEKNWKSTEVKDEWRLFKTSNISRMWLTGRFFQVGELRDSRNGAGFSTGKDKSMTQVEVQFDSSKARKFQQEYNKKTKEPLPVVPIKQNQNVATEPKGTQKPVKPSTNVATEKPKGSKP